MTEGRPFITLLELNGMIRRVMEDHMGDAYWVVGEISEMNEARSGHCYLELVEKNEASEQPLAKSRASIWAGTYRMLKPYFEKSTGQLLAPGIKILVKVNVRYHEQYGLSLTVTDIEPAFTLGDLEMKRQQTIQKLKEEGIFDLNRQLEMDPLTRRIAIISSPTAAGYGDFITQLENNAHGFHFSTVLFPAYMQGHQAVNSMIDAMEKVYRYAHLFHALVIIRGGGSRSELACFDSYELSSHICQFPLPVMSGIGHERDVSVADMVAHSRFKTPTATAQFFVDNLHESLGRVENVSFGIFDMAEAVIRNESSTVGGIAAAIQSFSRRSLQISGIRLQNMRTQLHQASRFRIHSHKTMHLKAGTILKQHTSARFRSESKELLQVSERMKSESRRIITVAIEKSVMLLRITEAHKPEKILKKGFCYTRKQGKTVKSAADLNRGDELETHLKDGIIVSKIEKISSKI
jgi:exodeoxyribonuclease VII large subunit